MPEQKIFFETAKTAIENNDAKCIVGLAAGGTGTTWDSNTILAFARMKRKVCLPVASTNLIKNRLRINKPWVPVLVSQNNRKNVRKPLLSLVKHPTDEVTTKSFLVPLLEPILLDPTVSTHSWACILANTLHYMLTQLRFQRGITQTHFTHPIHHHAS